MSDKDGGPAFPCPVGGSSFTGPDGYTSWQYPGCHGMTLIDWYVAHVTKEEYEELAPRDAGEAAEFLGITKEEYKPAMHWPVITSRIKFAIADAMLAERKKRGIGT